MNLRLLIAVRAHFGFRVCGQLLGCNSEVALRYLLTPQRRGHTVTQAVGWLLNAEADFEMNGKINR